MTKPHGLTAPQLEGVVWQKSSYSGSGESQCVEIADVLQRHRGIAVRDSKNPSGSALLLSVGAFADFIADVSSGRAG
ncbi:DUF397 domain-containing protein [Streptomyces sp. AJS327]|uniref:DUF397 domain-containing protein n=1 Tax=Streptomyces sp. AJS327 TaxID=2545265 RepID=UPI001854BB8E|nr:DUF397 domain-containing protein [Streptomyces sp. AJS327]MBA0053653.1 DUF397 domain-containing protein [Streptomyces sp. AJS327]